MRMMIVDDEQWILDGLKRQLDWRQLGIEIVCEAQNGMLALDQYQIFAPDIVLIDIRMPIMDGLQFAEHVQENGLECAIIVMSGYADFEYAQRALKCGVTGFVTKPIDRGELEEAVRRAVAVVSERRALEAYRYSSDFSRESQTQWRRLQAAGVLPESGRMFAIEFETEPNEQELRYLKRCASERCRFFFQLPEGPFVFIGICDHISGQPDALQRFIGHMMKGVDIAGNAIVSRSLETSRSAEYYVQHLLLVLDSIRSVKQGEILLEEDFTAGRDRVTIPYDEAERLIRAIGEMDETQALQRLSTLRGFLLSSLNYERGLLMRLLLSGMDAQLRECGVGIHQIFADHIQFVNRPGVEESREKEYLILEDGIRRSVEYLRGKRQNQSGKVVDQVQKYIDAHYDEDISLTSLATRFVMEPSQLSREFKRYTGTNLNRYIRQTRLHRAAVLLSNTDMKASEVSRRVGYDNPEYFMKLFREEYNLTPSAYRNLLNDKNVE